MNQFTPRLQQLLAITQRIASECGDGYVGTEHLALAMLRQHENLGNRLLAFINLIPSALALPDAEVIARFREHEILWHRQTTEPAAPKPKPDATKEDIKPPATTAGDLEPDAAGRPYTSSWAGAMLAAIKKLAALPPAPVTTLESTEPLITQLLPGDVLQFNLAAPIRQATMDTLASNFRRCFPHNKVFIASPGTSLSIIRQPAMPDQPSDPSPTSDPSCSTSP